MSNHHHETAASAPSSRKCECLPCDIPRFCRNNYFTGKLLTERDFKAEQSYFVDKLRLHHLALHGWGVVCGLKVEPHPYCPDLRIVVKPGLAIDGCGREVRVMCDVELPLLKPEPPPPEKTDPCPAEPQQQPKEPTAHHLADQQPYQDDEPGSPECPPEPCPPQPELLTLYVCLHYAECEEEFRPAPFDECACGADSQKPNRICQSYRLELTTDPPEYLEKIKALKSHCEVGDCESLYESFLEGCLKPCDLECIPIAVITNYVRGKPVTKEMIDNKTYRPLLPSTSLLDQIIRCILEKLPTRCLTHIQDIGWTHRGVYGCHDFMRQFIGEGKGFEVTFDGPVHPDGLSRRTFQATVVRYPEAGAAGKPEIAPGRVRWNADNTRAYLEIDPGYAQRNLHNARFDLFIQLRCNLLVDARGNPVDGDFLAELDDEGKYQVAFPTGDGIPGGLFESWIRVRS